MIQTKAYTNVLAIFLTVIATTTTHSSVSKHFYDNSKILQVNDNLQHNFKTTPKNLVNAEDNYFNSTTASVQKATAKKWQVGRVSRKQYEIVNMLWRKTNIFSDEENTSQINVASNTTKKNSISRPDKSRNRNDPERYNFFIPRPVLQPITPSYIEFYYLDETDESIKQKEINNVISQRKIKENVKREQGNLKDFTFSVLRSPFFAFHINDPVYKRPTRTASPKLNSDAKAIHDEAKAPKPISYTLSSNIAKFQNLFVLKKNPSTTKFNNIDDAVTENNVKISLKEDIDDDETCPVTYVTPTYRTKGPKVIKSSVVTTQIAKGMKTLTTSEEPVSDSVESTTVYDKIKFFEMYDTRTSLNTIDRESPYQDDRDNSARENELRSEEKILLEHVDQDIRHQDDVPHKMKYAKKHIEGLENKADEVRASYEKTSTSNKISNVTINQTNNSSNPNKNDTESSSKPQYFFDKNLNPAIFTNMSRRPHWSEYSFAAVYVYDRSQIHCDAAAISPHWLIASASCLSRHRDNPEGDRSAFVTYCGASWWNPERIAYVKYSHVHPRYHPRDRIRRHLYNIGVIQVVSSMASACASWAPISIMSHNFATSGEGVMASAVGWGLDRYNTNYAYSELPRSPLAVYEGMVYSDSCPGNSDYRKAKQSNEEGINNVYCLTLPPYSGEQNDAIHGSLLLVGGKLVGLYLQEERRQWGDQSAQYTGVWRLFPWVHAVALEPEGNDFFL